MEAVARLHTLPGLALMGALIVLALVSAALALTDRAPTPWLDFARRVLLGIVVVEAAVGLVLALRGSEPNEWIHWLYGGLIIAALLTPPSIVSAGTPRARSGVLAVASLLAAVLAWRLWGSG